MPVTERRPDTRSVRRLNIAAAWVALVSAAAIFVLNVTWERPFVERVCEPRPGPLPELCTTFRALTDDQWRSTGVILLLMLWAIAGAVAWRSRRPAQLMRKGPPTAFSQRTGISLLSFRRRIVSTTPGLLAAVSFSVREGTTEQRTVPVDLACGATEAGEFCQTSTVVVQQTVITDVGMAAWPQAVAWALFGLRLLWWMYVVAAEKLARRFGEERPWRTAVQM